jgi:hypothetical protein
MCAKPFDKLMTGACRSVPDTRRAHSSIVHLIFTASVSDAFQVDATIWFARSVIARKRPQQRDMEVGGLWTARLTPSSSAWGT